MATLKNKKILITGGTGLVGRALLKLLAKMDIHKSIVVVSLNRIDEVIPRTSFIKADLTKHSADIIRDSWDIVFHIAGFRGSPLMTATRQYEFFKKNLQCNLNVLDTMLNSDMEWGIYTSSLGVYGEGQIKKEDEIWNGLPSKNDWYAGWAKRMGELQIDAYEAQFKKRNISIVMPATIYGRHDNFSLETSMVVAALIRKTIEASQNKSTLVMWGDGSPIRDFVHASDVAKAMLFLIDKEITSPVNVGSGTGVSILELAEAIISSLPNGMYKPTIELDLSKPMGDKKRILDTSRLTNYGFTNSISLKDGIKDTIGWYMDNVN